MLTRISAVVLLIFLLLTSSCARGEQSENFQIQAKDGGITILEDREYFDVLLKRINDAKSNILISMYVFKTTGKGTDSANRVKDALIRASKQGVNVKVLLELEEGNASTLNEENRYTADRLVRGGVKVYFDSPERRTHAKVVVIDNKYSFIGSHNLTLSALQHNKELSLMIESEEVAAKAAKYIEDMIAKAKIPN